MKENLKYLVTLSSIGFFSFLKITLLGVLSTVIVITIEFIILTKSLSPINSAHASAIPVFIIFVVRPVGAILWYLTCLASPILIFIVGNKYIITKLINRVIRDKSEGFIYPVLDKLLFKIKTDQPELIKNTADSSLAKLKVIQSIKNDRSENKLLKRIILFGLKKTKLDTVDFNQENINYYDIIKMKTIESLKNISEPSRTAIWIIIGVQWAILVFIWLTDY